MSNRLRKYFALRWPQIVFVLVLALIIAILQEPHPVRYALAGLLVLMAGVGIFLKVKDRSTGTAREQDQTGQ